MVNMRAVALSVLLGAFSTTTAYSHWRFTKWDMTPAQVVSASGKSVQRVDPNSSGSLFKTRSYAKGETSIEGEIFAAYFYFFSEKGPMSAIRLEPKQDERTCTKVEASLIKQFGTPSDRELQEGASGVLLANKTLRWTEKISNDRLMFASARFKPGRHPDGRVVPSRTQCRVVIQPPA